ncbi:hypothetical protein AAFF_G00317020 [Aldrovandia affinis]|uniref:Uncharacterized protein n=1 Tax=Aldrovandia affinis TaxID=143900 RepID=A0AAD7VZS9_9TELE|nr:hypothetical protein AAFF_G00317020 [Aldrovandia affinis]
MGRTRSWVALVYEDPCLIPVGILRPLVELRGKAQGEGDYHAMIWAWHPGPTQRIALHSLFILILLIFVTTITATTVIAHSARVLMCARPARYACLKASGLGLTMSENAKRKAFASILTVTGKREGLLHASLPFLETASPMDQVCPTGRLQALTDASVLHSRFWVLSATQMRQNLLSWPDGAPWRQGDPPPSLPP